MASEVAKKNTLSYKMKLEMFRAFDANKDEFQKKRLSKQQVAEFLTKKIGVEVTSHNVARMAGAMGITFARSQGVGGRRFRAIDLARRIEDLELRMAHLEKSLGVQKLEKSDAPGS